MFETLSRLYRWMRQRRQPKGEPPLLFGLDTPLHIDPIADPARLRRLRLRVEAMPALTREIYLLHMVDGMSIEQIADRLAIPRRLVLKNVRLALTILMIPADRS